MRIDYYDCVAAVAVVVVVAGKRDQYANCHQMNQMRTYDAAYSSPAELVYMNAVI
jgi:hypothetical protein